MNRRDQHQLELLFEAYVESELSDADAARLGDWLRTDGQAVDQFVRTSYLHAQLYELARQRSLRSDVLQQAEKGGDALIHAATIATPSRARSAGAAQFLKFSFLASALAATIVLAWWGLMARPVVAQISEASVDVVWTTHESAPAAGDLLRAGARLNLTRGRVVATLVSGTKLIVTAPALVTISDRNAIELESGRIGAVVPPQAAGFHIDTALGRFVDLGTEFTLNLVDARTCLLTVFRGLVELQPGPNSSGGPLRVPGGRAVRYDADSGEVAVLPYEEQLRKEL